MAAKAKQFTHAEVMRALSRVYGIRAQNRSFAITLPPAIAQPFIDRFGGNIMYEITNDGILIKPVPTKAEQKLPGWMQNGRRSK